MRRSHGLGEGRPGMVLGPVSTTAGYAASYEELRGVYGWAPQLEAPLSGCGVEGAGQCSGLWGAH